MIFREMLHTIANLSTREKTVQMYVLLKFPFMDYSRNDKIRNWAAI